MSVNDDLSPPPKPRISPLEFCNKDLVSRLLAATPPYLYNMPVVPNSFFFSEMLRSFVQAKTAANNAHLSNTSLRNNDLASSATSCTAAPTFHTNGTPTTTAHPRRSRKRSWHQSWNGHPRSSRPDKCDVPVPSWSNQYDGPKPPPLFLDVDSKLTDTVELPAATATSPSSSSTTETCKTEMHQAPPSQPFPLMFQHLGLPGAPTAPPTTQHDTNAALTTPFQSTPPVWYPPMYPYGIDPLHFFIDLRVSGHIYDRKKDSPTASNKSPPAALDHQSKDAFRSSRHTSAFTVPSLKASGSNMPMNLSNNTSPEGGCAPKMKYDISSMVNNDLSNRTGTGYVMKNINSIYRHVKEDAEDDDCIIEPKCDTQTMLATKHDLHRLVFGKLKEKSEEEERSSATYDEGSRDSTPASPALDVVFDD